MFRYKLVDRQGVDTGQYNVSRSIKKKELREIFRDRMLRNSLAGSEWFEQSNLVNEV
jgi:hypothetical protein